MIGPSKSKHIFIIVSSILLFSFFFSYAIAETYSSKKLNNLIPKIKEKLKKNPNLFCGIYIKADWLDEEVSINGDYSFSAASLIKLPIAVILLQEVEKGEKSFEDQIEIKDKHIAEGSGILYKGKSGRKVKVKDVFELMLTISDNTAFNMIVDYLGGIAACNRKLAALGLNETKLIDYIGDFSGRNRTSPHDLTIVLNKSFDENIFNKKTEAYFKDILLKCTNTSLIKRGLKNKTKFAHKTGTIGIAIGDSGVIYMPWGKKLYLSIIVKRPFNDYRAKELIRDLTRIIVDELG